MPSDLDNKSAPQKRPIRSYVIRSGRLTLSQRKAIDQYWQQYIIEFQTNPLQLENVFPANLPLIVEIGFGMGDSLLEMAIANPESNYLGIEVHRPGVGKLLNGIDANQLSNLKLVCHDAKEVLQHCLVDESIDKLLIFFPDPWHKKRHNKRRLVQAEFIELLSRKLKHAGEIHLATDWKPYAEHMMEVMQSIDSLSNSIGDSAYWASPARPVTKFERRGQRLGHGVWDLLFRKN